MEGAALQQRAADRTNELPGAELTHPFGDGWEVWKVRGKVLMLQTNFTGEPLVILKSDPGEARALRSAYEDITPGYHMNKQHWITLRQGNDLDQQLVDDLVTESYLLVVGGLPQKDRPVDPATFGGTNTTSRMRYTTDTQIKDNQPARAPIGYTNERTGNG